MANYTTADVKRLRELTGSGMMDCKNALAETDGDFDKAVEILRIKGAKDVGKRAGRSTAEGIVVARDGVMVEVNSETDFVAKSDDFVTLANTILDAAVAGKPADVAALLALPAGDKTVDELLQEAAARLGEKLEIKNLVSYEGEVATYLHRRSAGLPPAVGVLVAFTGAGDAAAEAARAAAMQVAALKAQYVSREAVPAETVEAERRIAAETAKEEGKPEAALPKIVEGRVNGFYKDVVLVEQKSVIDSSKTVGDLLTEAGASITAFTRFEIGQ